MNLALRTTLFYGVTKDEDDDDIEEDADDGAGDARRMPIAVKMSFHVITGVSAPF